jgi:hypothetical protein
MLSGYACYGEMAVGILGIVLALYERNKRRTERENFYSQLVLLKPGIQGQNRDEVLRAINDTLDWLKPSKSTEHSRLASSTT